MIRAIIEYIEYRRKVKAYADEVNRWNNKANLYKHYGVWNGRKVI